MRKLDSLELFINFQHIRAKRGARLFDSVILFNAMPIANCTLVAKSAFHDALLFFNVLPLKGKSRQK